MAHVPENLPPGDTPKDTDQVPFVRPKLTKSQKKRLRRQKKKQATAPPKTSIGFCAMLSPQQYNVQPSSSSESNVSGTTSSDSGIFPDTTSPDVAADSESQVPSANVTDDVTDSLPTLPEQDSNRGDTHDSENTTDPKSDFRPARKQP